MTFRTWDQLSEVEQLQSTFSDAHKDAYGFRPRWMSTEQWNSVEWLQAQIEGCSAVIQLANEREAETQREGIIAFEHGVDAVIAAGAKDRATALRWIMQASDCNGDWEFFCYQNDLPYGYFKEAA